MKLNQVIAIEKGIKTKVQADVDAIHKASQKPATFDGFAKKYRKTDEGGEDVPDLRQNVQMVAKHALDIIAERLTEYIDVTAQKDFANCQAVADVTLDEEAILSRVPVSHLLFIEHQLTDLHTIVSKFPVLDPAERWTFDPQSNLHHTEPTMTTRTQKVQQALVLYPATEKHPAQTQVVVQDKSVGTYEHVKYSGALPEPERRKLLGRIEQAQKAVKLAREQANMIDAPKQDVGKKVFGWLFRA